VALWPCPVVSLRMVNPCPVKRPTPSLILPALALAYAFLTTTDKYARACELCVSHHEAAVGATYYRTLRRCPGGSPCPASPLSFSVDASPQVRCETTAFVSARGRVGYASGTAVFTFKIAGTENSWTSFGVCTEAGGGDYREANNWYGRLHFARLVSV
jgi:hypothetical protein